MHVQTDGPEKTNDADVTIVAHAMRVRTTMLSLCGFWISYVLKLQDKHNASWFTICREPTEANSTAKLAIFSQCPAIQCLKSSGNSRKRIEKESKKNRIKYN